MSHATQSQYVGPGQPPIQSACFLGLFPRSPAYVGVGQAPARCAPVLSLGRLFVASPQYVGETRKPNPVTLFPPVLHYVEGTPAPGTSR